MKKTMWINKERDQEKIINLLNILLNKHVNGRGLIVNPDAKIIAKELQSMSNDQFEEYELIASLQKMKKVGKSTLEEFENIRAEIRDIKSNREWTLFIPIDIKLPKKKIILGSYIVEVIGAKKELFDDDLKAFPYNHQKKFDKKTSKNHLQITAYGMSVMSAWESIEHHYKSLIGLIDFTQNRNVFHYVGNHKRSKQKDPDYVIGISKTDKFYFDFVQPLIDNSSGRNLNDDQKKFFNSVLPILAKDYSNDSLSKLIADIFRLYHESMASLYDETVFIRLWQIAEEITLSENVGGKSEKIISRLKWHFENDIIPGGNIKFTLDLLRKKRNRMVHSGINTIDQDDINIIKMLCDNAIIWLIKNRKNIENRSQLELFYEYRTVSKKKISDIYRVAKFLEKK